MHLITKIILFSIYYGYIKQIEEVREAYSYFKEILLEEALMPSRLLNLLEILERRPYLLSEPLSLNELDDWLRFRFTGTHLEDEPVTRNLMAALPGDPTTDPPPPEMSNYIRFRR